MKLRTAKPFPFRTMYTAFQITEDHKRWIKSARRKYKRTSQFWLDLIQKQDGKCALTGAPLLFDSRNGTPKKGCRFHKRQKPLLCKMSPILAGARVEAYRREIMFVDELTGCPAKIPDDFRERVKMAIFQLMLGGIWKDNHTIMREDPVDAGIFTSVR